MLYHLGFAPEQITGTAHAILCGDPGRVPSIAAKLEAPAFLAGNREYTSWTGRLSGAGVIVISHGIGGPSTAICAEELALCGVKTMIRVGTCGGMQLPVLSGDLVIANAAIRQEGTSLHYLPVEFPAVSDFSVTAALKSAAENILETCPGPRRGVHTGVVQCKDSFYGQHDPDGSPVGYELKDKWQAWLKGGCLASEMETAALYTVAAARGIRAGCVLHVLWNQEREKAGLDNPTVTDTGHAVDVAVEAMRRLIG